jgi:predicted nucleic acid-binding protein
MKDRVFIDTNIWVYASLFTDTDLQKREVAINLIQTNTNLFVSTQVLNEFYSVLLKYRINTEKILAFINEILENTNICSQDLDTLKKSWSIIKNYQLSLWDSLIIAAALQNNCSILYTEDMQHNQIIENSLTIINPFK